MRNAITEAAIQKAGGFTALANQLGLTHSAVWQWKEVPIKHVNKVAEITGIPRKVLRPDVFDEAA